MRINSSIGTYAGVISLLTTRYQGRGSRFKLFGPINSVGVSHGSMSIVHL